MKSYITIAIKPEVYETYKTKLKAMGYTWNVIVTRGIAHIMENEIGKPLNSVNVVDKLQRQLTRLGSENELLRQRIKRQELKDKVESGEITQEQYAQFKAMYDESIQNIERRHNEDRRVQVDLDGEDLERL